MTYRPDPPEISDAECLDVIISGLINDGCDENYLVDLGATTDMIDSAHDSPYIKND